MLSPYLRARGCSAAAATAGGCYGSFDVAVAEGVGADWIVDSHQVRPGLYVGRTLLPAAHHDLKVRIVNTTAEPLTIPEWYVSGQPAAG